MARIIYKGGCEGQNRLECIEGIEIDLLNGQKALIYPRYSNEELLDLKDRDRWLDAGISETRALRLRDNQAATAAIPGGSVPATARKNKQENMTTTRYMVSSDYFNRHDEWWFDTEEAARKKRAELLATLDTRREVRMRVVQCDRT